MTCTLLTSSYLSLCQNISSTASPELSVCLSQDSGTCDDFVDEDCEMSGQVRYETDTVTDAFACQDFLQLLGPMYEAEVFFFSDLEGVCYLLDRADRTCASMSGPTQPSLGECEEDTTTTTAIESGMVNYLFVEVYYLVVCFTDNQNWQKRLPSRILELMVEKILLGSYIIFLTSTK